MIRSIDDYLEIRPVLGAWLVAGSIILTAWLVIGVLALVL